MLFYKDLKEIDSSITLCFGDETAVEVSSISHAYAPQINTFIFVKEWSCIREIIF